MRKEIVTKLNSIASASKSKEVYVIEYNNTRLSFNSKSSWSTIGAAKNALRLRMDMGHWRERLAEIKKLEDEGVIKYVKL